MADYTSKYGMVHVVCIVDIDNVQIKGCVWRTSGIKWSAAAAVDSLTRVRPTRATSKIRFHQIWL